MNILNKILENKLIKKFNLMIYMIHFHWLIVINNIIKFNNISIVINLEMLLN